jgi:hypothetical protein
MVSPSETQVAVGVPPSATVPGVKQPGVCLAAARLRQSVVPDGALVVTSTEPGAVAPGMVTVATPCRAQNLQRYVVGGFHIVNGVQPHSAASCTVNGCTIYCEVRHSDR